MPPRRLRGVLPLVLLCTLLAASDAQGRWRVLFGKGSQNRLLSSPGDVLSPPPPRAVHLSKGDRTTMNIQEKETSDPPTGTLSASSPSGHYPCHLEPSPFGGVLADCRGLSLTEIPPDLPADTTWLRMDESNLSRLQNTSFVGLTSLRRLWLNFTRLTLTYESFPHDVFRPLTSLEDLNIGDEILTDAFFYPGDIFLPLRNLTSLTMQLLPNAVFGSQFCSLKNLVHLSFPSSEAIIHLKNETFVGFSESPIVRLFLEGDIRSLEAATLSPFQHLSELHITNNLNLKLDYIVLALHPFLGRNMSVLNFHLSSSTKVLYYPPKQLQTCSAECAQVLSQICVSKLILSGIGLNYLDVRHLMGQFVHCLRHLDLSENPLRLPGLDVFFVRKFSQLEYLDLSPKSKFCDDRFSSRHDVQNLTQVFFAPPSLKYINVAQLSEHGGAFSNFNLSNANNVKWANFSCTGITFEGVIHGLHNVETLDLSYNSFSAVPLGFFVSLPSVKKLGMRRTYLDQDFLMTSGRHLLQPLQQLTDLDLADNGLQALPQINFPRLSRLDLSGNSFTDSPLNLDLLPEIGDLNLARNAFTQLSPRTRRQLDTVASRHPVKVSLEFNPLSCDCSALDFLAWLRDTRVSFSRGGNYSCLGLESQLTTTAKALEQYDAIWWSCYRSYIATVCGSSVAAVLFVAVVSFFVVKFKTHLRRMILRQLGFGQAVRKRADYHFDAFVAFSMEDVGFVMRTLRHRLEDHGLRLFLLGRNDRPGSVHADEIFRGVHSSWRVLFVLTPNFLQDEYCQYMIDVAVSSVSPLNSDRILLLLQQPIEFGRLPRSLMPTVEESAIFDMTGQGDHDPAWTKLCRRVLEEERDPCCQCLTRCCCKEGPDADADDEVLLMPPPEDQDA